MSATSPVSNGLQNSSGGFRFFKNLFSSKPLTPSKKLERCFKKHELDKVDKLLKENPDLIKLPEIHSKFFDYLAEYDDPSRIENFSKKDIKIASCSKKGLPLVHYILKQHWSCSYETLLKFYPELVSEINPNTGQTILHLIVKKNRMSAFSVGLLNCEADFKRMVHEKDKGGKTPLLIAVEKNHEVLFKEMLQLIKKLDKNAMDDWKQIIKALIIQQNFLLLSLFLKMCKKSHLLSEIFKNFEAESSLLFHAIRHGSPDAILEVLRYCPYLAEIDPATKRTALHFFAEEGNFYLVSQFIIMAKKADLLSTILNLKDHKGATAASIALFKDYSSVFHCLLENGADATALADETFVNNPPVKTRSEIYLERKVEPQRVFIRRCVSEFKDFLPQIFSFLSQKELIACAMVCRSWRVIIKEKKLFDEINHEEIYQSVFKNFNYLSRSDLIESIKKANSLKIDNLEAYNWCESYVDSKSTRRYIYTIKDYDPSINYKLILFLLKKNQFNFKTTFVRNTVDVYKAIHEESWNLPVKVTAGTLYTIFVGPFILLFSPFSDPKNAIEHGLNSSYVRCTCRSCESKREAVFSSISKLDILDIPDEDPLLSADVDLSRGVSVD